MNSSQNYESLEIAPRVPLIHKMMPRSRPVVGLPRGLDLREAENLLRIIEPSTCGCARPEQFCEVPVPQVTQSRGVYEYEMNLFRSNHSKYIERGNNSGLTIDKYI